MPVEVPSGNDRRVVVQEQDPPRVVTTRTTDRVTVGRTGISGIPGAPGRPGADGADGLSGGSYEHAQTIASWVWTVQHNLGYRPGGLRVFGTDSEEVDPPHTHLSDDVLLLTFTEPTAGTAYIS